MKSSTNSHTSTDSSISTTSPSPTEPKSSGPTAHPPPPSKPSTTSGKAGPASKPIEELIPTAAQLSAAKQRKPEAVDENALAAELRAIAIAFARAAPGTASTGHRTAIRSAEAETSGTLQKLISILKERGYQVSTRTTGYFVELAILWKTK